MKIGVFGDSFAAQDQKNIWWQYLQTKHGHQVDSFGSAGSSMLYSAMLIDQKASTYDFNIWCLTAPGRYSIQIEDSDKSLHLSLNNIAAREASWRHTNSVTYKKIQIVSMYFKHLFDIKQEVFVGHTLAKQALATHSNLMIVPCFDLPLGAYQFNLSGLSHYELQNFFPDGTTGIFEKYTELRSGHLSDENNHVLADLINQNLKPGIFQADYLQFKSPTVPLETLLAKK